jgi:hypothetical protein
VKHAARAAFLKGLEALNRRDIGDGIVSVCHYHGVEPFDPPIVPLLSLLTQDNPPLSAYLFDQLYGRAIRYKVLVAIALQETGNVTLDDLPVTKWSLLAIESNREF